MIVIGAGVVGCFTARELMRSHLTVAVLEKNSDACGEVSKANSGLIHCGYNPKSDTEKAAITVRAALDYPNVCRELDVRFERTGSLMFAGGPNGVARLQGKYRRGLENGVKEMALLNREETLALEPGLNPALVMSLYSPIEGVVSPWEFGMAALENAADNGAEIFFDHAVSSIERTARGFNAVTPRGTFAAKYIINCAGLFADKINDMVAEPFFAISARRGQYLLLDTYAGGLVKHAVTEVKENGKKGVYILPTVHGNMLIGPITHDIGEKDDYSVKQNAFGLIKTDAEGLISGIPWQHMIRSFSGIRPRVRRVCRDARTGEIKPLSDEVTDYILGEAPGCPGFFNAAGIYALGVTNASEIAKAVVKRLLAGLPRVRQNESFDPRRRGVTRFAALSPQEKQAVIAQDAAFGKVVCRCRKVTEAEVVDCIRRKAGATTLDGVKRRADCGMGRCQGGFCGGETLKILARELGEPPEEIKKDGPDSHILTGRL
ncbi:MAG: NAD(P)/FAD-dependent oxidoreductase [Clostridiales bacterium]|nr:NAD(P)/FAD-dependent oxidoreductase [Clostridiales bacterium]